MVKTLGLTLSDITPELKDKFSLADDAKGVVVVDVAKDSSGGRKGVRPGDVIMEAAQEEVKSPDEVSRQDRRGKEIRAQIDPAAGRSPGRSALCRAAHRPGLRRGAASHVQRSRPRR